MISIIPYEHRYHAGFKKLNIEWLEQYNLLESHDLEIINDPEGTVLAGGGCIFLAIENDAVIGTAGLWKQSADEYELVKMAVDPAHRGKGIGKLLLDRCITEARQQKAARIILFSNSQLKTAIGLYEQYGFHHVVVEDSPFETADVKMELAL